MTQLRAAMPMWQSPGNGDRCVAGDRQSSRLLLRRLPGVCAFPGARGHCRRARRDRDLPDDAVAAPDHGRRRAPCCLRLSPKGLMRWYAGCRTPVGNTASSARVPFVGVPHSFIDRGDSGRSLDDALGPIIGYANARFATGGLRRTRIPRSRSASSPAACASSPPPGWPARAARLRSSTRRPSARSSAEGRDAGRARSATPDGELSEAERVERAPPSSGLSEGAGRWPRTRRRS